MVWSGGLNGSPRIDGSVIPIPEEKVDAYVDMAREAGGLRRGGAEPRGGGGGGDMFPSP